MAGLTAAQWRVLAAIWLCFLARGLFYSCVTPLWEGFAEYGHYAWLEAVSHGTLLPGRAQPLARDVEVSMHLAPLPRAVAGAGFISHDEFWKLSPRDRERRESGLHAIPAGADHLAAATARTYEGRQPPLYYWLTAPVYAVLHPLQLLDRVEVLRALNVLLASLSVPLAFLLAQARLRDDASALCAVSAFSAMPQMMFNISHVGSDGLALVLATAIALLIVRARQEWDAVALGVLLGAGLLTEWYFIALWIACVLLLLPRWRMTAPVAAIPALIAGWWYVRDWTAMPRAYAMSLWDAAVKLNWIAAADFSWHTLIWAGNWSYLGLRSWTYRILLLVFVVALFGLARSGRHPGAPVAALVALHLAFVFALAEQSLSLFRAGGAAVTPGWSFACLSAAGACLLVFGFRTLASKAAAVPAFVLAALDMYGSHVVLTPYYSGLISYSATGRLAAFPLGRWSYQVFDRLAVNKPYWLGSPAIAGLWAAYVVATFTLIGIAVWAARAVRVDLWRSPE